MTDIDFGGHKCVVDADGTVRSVPLTPEEIAQREIDAAQAAARRAAEQAQNDRATAIRADGDRTDWLAALKTASLQQIDSFVRTRINADAVTDLATARACLKRIETAIVIVAKLIALDRRT